MPKTSRISDSDRIKEILQFVKENPNCTKADVVRYMKGRSSVITTHAILSRLINEGKINMFMKNIQTHLLTINEESEYNKIYKYLSEIELLIHKINPTVKKIQNALRSTNVTVDFHVHKELKSLNSNFIEAYRSAINLILFDLLPYIHYNIKSEKDSHILRSKIFDLLTAVNIQASTLNILDQLNRIAYDSLKTVTPSPLTDRLEIKTVLIDDVIRSIEKYKGRFLTELQGKST